MENTFNETQEWGEKFFKMRDYTAIPLVVLLLLIARPTVVSATLGMLLIFLGELIRIYSVAFIGGVARSRSATMGEKLISEGPFALVRNPLYIGNFFLVLGFAIYGGKSWFVILSVILFSLQYRLIVDYEESLLEEKFGNDYLTYRNQVPAWVPKRAPSLSEWVWPQDFTDAIRSEKRTFTAIAAVLTLLLILSPH